MWTEYTSANLLKTLPDVWYLVVCAKFVFSSVSTLKHTISCDSETNMLWIDANLSPLNLHFPFYCSRLNKKCANLLHDIWLMSSHDNVYLGSCMCVSPPMNLKLH